MLEMNTHAVGFDLEMEVLCSMSPHPVPIASLMEDFGWGYQDDFRKIAKGLNTRWPNSVITGRGSLGEGNQAWISKTAWPQVVAACSKYWKKIYG